MTNFKPNPNLQRELAAEIRARRALMPSARRAAAEANALRHSAMPRKGHRPIEVAELLDGDVVVVNTNHGAHLEEFGLAYTPLFAPLRRGASAAGLELRES